MTDQDPTLLAQPTQLVRAGTQLLKRLQTSVDVLYIDSGRVDLGVMGESTALEHQLGVAEGPCWLEASAALLNLPSTVDAVAETDVLLRRVPVHEFRAILSDRRSSAHAVLLDIARAHCQQTELTVSRMAKDAEARCAEWLLRHAQPGDKGECSVRLLQRKRLIAAQLGIAPETLSRVLRHLRERSLISGSGRVVNLVDPSGLRALAGN
jgi:CRP-like cAMP-binding protein